MLEVVSKIIEMSIQASFVICVILLVRVLFLRLNIPKRLVQALWVIPLFRMVCPVTIASRFSFVPSDLDFAGDNINDVILEMEPLLGLVAGSETADTNAQAGIGLQDGLNTTQNIVGNTLHQVMDSTISMGADVALSPVRIFMLIWLIGLGALIVYSIVATIRLRRKLVGRVWVTNNYYRADHIETPFVLGVFRPKIYLPSSLSEDATDMILQHENMHIRRKDHIVKLIVFAITCVYWFSPLAWVMYILFCRDMESAVDEKVISKYDEHERKTYATLLLALSTGHRHLISAPLAFGEGDVKGRVTNVVKYKKPITILVVIAAVVAVVLALTLLTSQKYVISKNAEAEVVSITYGELYEGYELTLSEAEKVQLINALRDCKIDMTLKTYIDWVDGDLYEVLIWANGNSCWLTIDDDCAYLQMDNIIYSVNSHGMLYGILEKIRATEHQEQLTAVTPLGIDYAQNEDGTWKADGYKYKYRLVLDGHWPNAAMGTVYVVLSNDPDITFEEAMWASGISSKLEDYFTRDYAVIVEWLSYQLPAEGGLPIYAYMGNDPIMREICRYMVAIDLPAVSERGETEIPAPVILKIDDSNPQDIKVWGNFWSYSYTQNGSTLTCEGGGEQPGIMHLAKTADGYIVIGFDGVRDGSYFTDDLRALCKGNLGLYQKFINNSEKEREEIRTTLIRDYVNYNDLDITNYQDFGWDPIPLE